MEMNDYQKQARSTAVYPKIGHNIVYVALGLAGEAGEVAEQVKKIFRDDGGIITEERNKKLVKELGDVLWYTSQVAFELYTTLNTVAKENLAKLDQRRKEGKLHGSGSNR